MPVRPSCSFLHWLDPRIFSCFSESVCFQTEANQMPLCRPPLGHDGFLVAILFLDFESSMQPLQLGAIRKIVLHAIHLAQCEAYSKP